MTSIVCGSCSASVPYGRLSCPSCGELLASVAGARRGPAAAVATAERVLPDVLYDASTAPAVDVEGELEHQRPPDGLDDALPWTANGSSMTAGGETNGSTHHAEPEADAIDDDEDGLGGLLTDDDADQPASTTGGPTWAIAGASLTGPTTPAYMPRAPRARTAEPAAATAMPADLPGAYLPPVPAVSVPAGPAGPARAWAGHAESADADPASTDGSTKPEGKAAVDASRLAEFVGSVSVAGAALAAVGFLLPWASAVIGSTGSGYFDRWGLAGPGHVVVVLAILAVLALSIVRNPIPVWLRTGVAGLAIGALLLGLAWPYLLNPALEAAPGVLIEAIGAIALIVAGILAIATDRHAEATKVV